jgi:hypothetical protein
VTGCPEDARAPPEVRSDPPPRDFVGDRLCIRRKDLHERIVHGSEITRRLCSEGYLQHIPRATQNRRESRPAKSWTIATLSPRAAGQPSVVTILRISFPNLRRNGLAASSTE